MLSLFQTLGLCLIVISLAGQPCATVTGKVVDGANGEGLPGANIQVMKAGRNGTSTDAAGSFQLNATALDTLRVSFVGYQTQQVVPLADCSVTVRLVTVVSDLNAVVIKSERLIAEEFTIRKIRKLEIYTNPSAKADPILAVNSTPSATTTDESANISLRGSSPAETGIFLNNVPIHDAVRYSQLNGIGTFSIFNTAVVSQVQVYPGNPPLEFGSTTSGLIALQTDEVIPAKPVHTLSLTLASMGLYMQRKLSRRSSLTVFSNYQPSVLIRALNPVAMERIRSFNSIDLGIHYFHKISDRTLLKVFTYGIRESYQFTAKEPTYTGDFLQEKYRNFTIINIRHRLKNSEVTLNNALSFSNAQYSLSTLGVKLLLRDFYTSFNYQYFGNKADVKTGISYDFRSSAYDGKYPRYPYALGEQYPVDSSSSDQAFKVPEVYLYLKFFLTPKVTLGTGLRKNLALERHENFLSSQLNLNFKPSKPWSINLAAGRYNKYQFAQGETADPFRIEADQYSLDISFNKVGFEHCLSLFYKKSSYMETRTAVRGLEWFIRYRFNGNLRGQLSLTSLDAQMSRLNLKVSSPYDIGYFIRGNLEYKFASTWTVTTVFLFRQGSFYIPVTGTTYDPALNVYVPAHGDPTRLPSYDIIDLSISKVLPIKESSAIVFASMGNVINFKNVRGYSYNFDYTSSEEELFSLRTFFIGFVVNY